MSEQAEPTGQRIEAIDFVRGAALFGILLMNITGFALPDAYQDPTNWGGSTGPDLWAWIITEIGFEGTQRGLFSILFGAGIILFTSRLEAKGESDVAMLWMRRCLILVGFGLFNAYVLLWPGDILLSYGVAGLLLFFARGLGGRTLLAAGALLLLLGAAIGVVETRSALAVHSAHENAVRAQQSGIALTGAQQQAVSDWRSLELQYKPLRADQDRAIARVRGGYLSAYPELAPDGVEMHTLGLLRYPHDTLGFMMIGMGLFQLGLLTGDRSRRLYGILALGGYGIGLTINTAETIWIMRSGFSVLAFIEKGISYDLGRLAMTIGHLGALLLIAKLGLLAALRRRMAAVGQMALTNYLSQSLFCLILFVGFGLYAQLSRAELYLVVVAIWAFQLVASPWWLARYRFGPVEWLWRALTYGSRPPLRRRPAFA